MNKVQFEQRTIRRFSLQLPLSVKMPSGDKLEIAAKTKDVSARGVFFFMDSDIVSGSNIEFTLTLPPEVTLTECIRVHCMGKVVRVDHANEDNLFGVAAAIEQYDFLTE